MAIIGKDIEKAAQLLKDGKLVAIPTETVYGLAANALNNEAVLNIFEAKNRPFFDPLILHLAGINKIKEYADLSDERLLKLAKTFWPGPLTLLLPKFKVVPDIVTSGLANVAVRIPNHPLTLSLLQLIDFPLAAPSANPFGYISPTSPEHVNKQLGNKVDYIVDGGKCDVGIESTIVGVEEGEICVYRLGGLEMEEIEKVVGKVNLKLNLSSNPKAPGQLKNHYAPRKKLLLGNLNKLIEENSALKKAAIVFGNCPPNKQNLNYFTLSESKNLKEAALNLFSILRELDESDCELIITEPLPEEGLGKAINDRLKRASS